MQPLNALSPGRINSREEVIFGRFFFSFEKTHMQSQSQIISFSIHPIQKKFHSIYTLAQYERTRSPFGEFACNKVEQFSFSVGQSIRIVCEVLTSIENNVTLPVILLVI